MIQVYKFTLGKSGESDYDILVHAISFDEAMKKYLEIYKRKNMDVDIYAVNFICAPKEVIQ